MQLVVAYKSDPAGYNMANFISQSMEQEGEIYRGKNFSKFEITLESTHHGPTALDKPVLFIEVGTTEKEWTNKELCKNVANIVVDVMSQEAKKHEIAICFGSTHYPKKFTKVLLEGEYSLGTIMP